MVIVICTYDDNNNNDNKKAMAALLRDRERLQAVFRLVLASASPRRKELLQTLGLPFDVVTSGFPEDLDKTRYSPAEYVVANAEKKCAAVAAGSGELRRQDGLRAVVIGADTVVSVDGQILEPSILYYYILDYTVLYCTILYPR